MRTGVSRCPSSVARQPALTFSGSDQECRPGRRATSRTRRLLVQLRTSTSRRDTDARARGARHRPQGQPRGGVLVRRAHSHAVGAGRHLHRGTTAGEGERGAVEHGSDGPGHRGRVDPAVDLELGSEPADGTGDAVAVGPVDLALEVRQLELGHSHGSATRGGRCVEPDHQPPGEHRGEGRRARRQVHLPGLPAVAPAAPRGSAPRPSRAAPRSPSEVSVAAMRPAQPQRRAGVARRGRPEADRVAVEGQLRAHARARRGTSRTTARGCSRGWAPAGAPASPGWRGRPPRRRSVQRAVLGHGDLAHHARLLLADAGVGGVAAAHAQARRRCSLAAAGARAARTSCPRRPAWGRPADGRCPGRGRRSRAGRRHRRVAGHVRHGHPHPVDRAPVQAAPRRARWTGRRRRFGDWFPASTRTLRTGAPEKPSTPACTDIRSSGVWVGEAHLDPLALGIGQRRGLPVASRPARPRRRTARPRVARARTCRRTRRTSTR